MDVLWLTPDKPANISVGRRRIADELERVGHRVVLRGTTAETVALSIRERGQYDVIVGTTRSGAIAGVPLSYILDVPLVVDHIDPIRQFDETNSWPLARTVRHLEHLAFRRSSQTLYVYPEEEGRVRRFAPAATKTDLGVEFDRFAHPDPQVLDNAMDRLDTLDLRENVAIYVGGLEPIYHIEELIASIDHLEDWSLVLLGSGSLEDVVEAAADTRDVFYLGTVPHEEVPGYLHAADVGVSLVDDPRTLKVLEYGAAKLPTVQLSGRAEDRLGTAVTYCGVEPRSIADAIQRTSGSKTDELHELAREYSWATIANQYRTVLEAVQDGDI